MIDFDIQLGVLLKEMGVDEPIELPRPIYILPNQYSWLKADVREQVDLRWRSKIRQAPVLIYSKTETPHLDDLHEVLCQSEVRFFLNNPAWVCQPCILSDVINTHDRDTAFLQTPDGSPWATFGIEWKPNRSMPDDVVLLVNDNEVVAALVGIQHRRLI